MIASVLSDPTWQTAIATWAIVAVTLAAAIVGGYAALTAARAFRLESQPVLVLRQLDREERPPVTESRLLQTFVVGVKGATIYEGVELRLETEADRRQQQGGEIVVEFRNVGRSPAIAVRVTFTVETPIMSDISVIDWNQSGVPAAPVIMQRGHGEVLIDAIPAQTSVYVVIATTVLNVITLRAARDGVHTEILGNSRRIARLPIVAPGPLQIGGV
jgi:hypothetical protein